MLPCIVTILFLILLLRKVTNIIIVHYQNFLIATENEIGVHTNFFFNIERDIAPKKSVDTASTTWSVDTASTTWTENLACITIYMISSETNLKW